MFNKSHIVSKSIKYFNCPNCGNHCWVGDFLIDEDGVSTTVVPCFVCGTMSLLADRPLHKW
jgi:transcription elongation factor Elf1